MAFQVNVYILSILLFILITGRNDGRVLVYAVEDSTWLTVNFNGFRIDGIRVSRFYSRTLVSNFVRVHNSTKSKGVISGSSYYWLMSICPQ